MNDRTEGEYKMLTDEQKGKLIRTRDGIQIHEVMNTVDKIEDMITPFKDFLNALGEDSNRDGLKETPYRFAKAMMEYTKGYDEDQSKQLEKRLNVHQKEKVVIKHIQFNSLCEHQLATFYGVIHVGYIPGNYITGLSKIARMVDGYAKRLQVQERLTTQIVTQMYRKLNAQGAMVVVEGNHYCMCGRGVMKTESSTITSAVRGAFEKSEVRNEFMNLIK